MASEGMLKFETNKKGSVKLVVVGIGGGGGNAVNWMIESKLEGVEYVAINTDAQDLSCNNADVKIQIGEKITGGLGAGGNPEKGQQSAEENLPEIENAIKGADMLFITAGMGGGTGTGAAPIVARLARELGILTVGIVTKPFPFEGKKRRDNADLGIDYMKKFVDSLVVVPNEKLILLADKNTTIEDALRDANDVLKQGVQGVTDIIIRPGLFNVDFADIRQVIANRGSAHMGMGFGKGEDRVEQAVRSAIENPLLETSINGAKAVLINVTGGYDLTLLEVDEAATRIEQVSHKDVLLIFGTAVYDDLADQMKITVIATGFGDSPLELDESEKPALDKPEVKIGIEEPDPAKNGGVDRFGVEPTPEEIAEESENREEDGPSFLKNIETEDGPGEHFGVNIFSEPTQESLEINDEESGLFDTESRFDVPDFLKRD